MLHLLKLEWMKVKNYKTFWIFLGLYVIGLFSIHYIFYYFQQEFRKEFPVELFPFTFPRIWQTVAWISSWLLYFPGMLMILIITNEFTYKTHRQNIVDGLTREQFIYSKILVAFTLALITTIISILNAILFGSLFGSSPTWEGSEYIVYGFLQALSYIFLAMILAVLIRRGGLAMAVFFLYGLVFEQLIGLPLHEYVIRGSWYYFPLQTTDVLIPVSFAKDVVYNKAPSTEVLIIMTMVYIGLYCFFSVRRFKTADL